ncbi:MAG: hypothetical protein IMW98_03440 [Firmicutes bacterium]|nr:hypothetical protein [Bacillota bacterium]
MGQTPVAAPAVCGQAGRGKQLGFPGRGGSGGDQVVVIAGPCAVESREQILTTARAVRDAGARMLRGGAFRPRTSPHGFQGLEEEGLRLLAEAREATGLPFVTEVMSPEAVPLVAAYADMLQIGARHMQNFPLLRAAGRARRPIMLKRGPWVARRGAAATGRTDGGQPPHSLTLHRVLPSQQLQPALLPDMPLL